MNRTNFLHALYALLMQAAFGILYGDWWMGAAFAVAWFISREHAHRQNDIADVTGVPVPKQNPLKGFSGWSLDAKLDALFPLIACAAVALIFSR